MTNKQQFDPNLSKLPPQAIEFEEAVLGASMQFKEGAAQMIELMTQDMFYLEKNGLLFNSIKSIFMRSEPIDMLTVSQQLRKEGNIDAVGGMVAISKLTDRVASPSNIESHIRIIIQKYISRQIIAISGDMIDKAYMEEIDVFDLLASFETTISNMFGSVVKTNYKNMKELVFTINNEITERTKSNEYTHGIASSVRSVNDLLGGYGKTDMIIIAARPAMGKSAFIVSEIKNIAKRGVAVGVFSLEMSGEQMAYRIASQETGIDLEILMKRQMDEGRLTHLYGNLGVIENLPIFIDDTGALSIFDFKARARRMKSKHNIGMIVIDYLQLMTVGKDSGKGNREQEVSLISRTIKALAKELDIPIIALSQLSRQVESRTDKRPLLSDLRESGSLEQDADIVSFLYRPEYYGINENEQGETTHAYGELLVAKNRHGKLGLAKMKFTDYLAMYSDQDYEQPIVTKSNISPNKSFYENDKDEPF
jgi:replicative DNA helicase